MSSAEKPSLGWIGLGSMGLGMASNIQKHLIEHSSNPLHYTNRTLSRGKPLQYLGGVPCQTVGDVVQSSDIIFISVSDDEALTSTIQSILSSCSIENKIIVDTTTVHPSTTSTINKQLTTAGASFIAAPVFGAAPVAKAGKLLVAIAGPPSAITTITPFLKGVIARNVIEVGPDPSKALLLKTTSNFIGAGLMYLLSEAHTLAEKAELSASVLESLVEENFGAYMHGISKRLTSGVYYPAQGQAPNSGLELGMKDVGHGLSIADGVGVQLKVGELSMGAMEEAKKFGDDKGRKLDSSSVFGAVRQRAGLDFETGFVKRRDGLGN